METTLKEEGVSVGDYYGSLLLSSVIIGLILLVQGRLVIRLVKGLEKKRWWIYMAILSPFLLITLYHYVFLWYLDLPYALRGHIETTEGVVETVYFPGGDNAFVLEGTEYMRNPWKFRPEEGERYRLNYLPHSKYVVDYVFIE